MKWWFWQQLYVQILVVMAFLTLISGITKLDSIRSLRSIGGLALLYYAASSLVVGTVGVAVALLIRPRPLPRQTCCRSSVASDTVRDENRALRHSCLGG